MRLAFSTLLLALTSFASADHTTATSSESTVSVNSLDVEFLTKLVSDVSNHGAAYFMFSRTAGINIPKYFGSLVDELGSYSNDDYTTLLRAADFPITSVEHFATKLDWYSSRLAVSGINKKDETTSSDGAYKAFKIPIGLAVAAGMVGLL